MKSFAMIRLLKVLTVFIFSFSVAEAQGDHPTDLTELSLEALMNLKVTSVSKREEKLSDASAAVYVITQEDLFRSGTTSIPEALRMVPGIQVAQIDANKWAISSRGFNGRFANKLLVLIDGRSVYTPLFSGVYWDIQNVPLEDIERIEVIRGPGATLWGANAVNGVINIITKRAGSTRGGSLTGGFGSEQRGFGSFRYSGALGKDSLCYRIYGKAFDWDNTRSSSGDEASDNWNSYRGGSRIDWAPSGSNLLTVQGDIYGGNTHQSLNLATLNPPYSQRVIDFTRFVGGSVLGRWSHTFSERSDFKLQLYFDRTDRENTLLKEGRNTFDVDFQHSFPLGDRNVLVWGFGYRLTSDDLTSSPTVSFDPTRKNNRLGSGFVQDEMTIIEHTLFLTLGSKFEHNDYTHFEVQPNARVLWTPHTSHTVWAAVSRAVRTPSRAESDVHIDLSVNPPSPNTGGLASLVTIDGNPGFLSEKLTAYELGYRYQGNDLYSFDFATFYNVCNDLRTAEPAAPPYFDGGTTPPHIVVPLKFDNQMDGTTYGAEVTGNWQPFDQWRVSMAYSWFKGELRPHSSSQDGSSQNEIGNSPEHQVNCRSYLNVAHSVQLDVALYYVDHLVNQNIPSYVRLDTRVGWSITQAIGVSLTIQNILQDHHQEFGSTELGEGATEVQRSVFGTFAWRF